jgi:hypothetical protein
LLVYCDCGWNVAYVLDDSEGLGEKNKIKKYVHLSSVMSGWCYVIKFWNRKNKNIKRMYAGGREENFILKPSLTWLLFDGWWEYFLLNILEGKNPFGWNGKKSMEIK